MKFFPLILAMSIAVSAGGSLVGAQEQCSTKNPTYSGMWNCIRGTVAEGRAGLMHNAQAMRYMAVGDALAEQVKAGQLSGAQAKAQLAVELERDNEAFEAARRPFLWSRRGSEVVYYLSREDVGRLAARGVHTIFGQSRHRGPSPLDVGNRVCARWRRGRRPLHSTHRIVMRRRARGSISAISPGRAVASVNRLRAGGRANDARWISVPAIRPVSAIAEQIAGFDPRWRAQAAPNVDFWMMSLTSRAGISSLAAQS